MYGVLILSLVVVSVSTSLQLSAREDKAYLLIKKVDSKNGLKQHAANLITNAATFFSRKKAMSVKQQNSTLERVSDAFKLFTDASEKYKDILNDVSINEIAEFEFNTILCDVIEIKEEAIKICQMLEIDPEQVYRDNKMTFRGKNQVEVNQKKKEKEHSSSSGSRSRTSSSSSSKSQQSSNSK